MTISRTLLLIPIALLLFWSCSNTRFLAEDELLYTGREQAEIIVEPEGLKTKEVKASVNSLTDHKVNNGILGMRILPPVGLWVKNYWRSNRPEEKRGWIYRTLSAEPVLVSDVNPDLRAQVIENELFDLGYFETREWATVETNRKNPKKATIRYHVRVTPPYSYRGIRFDSVGIQSERIDARQDSIGIQADTTERTGAATGATTADRSEVATVDSLISNSFLGGRIGTGDQFNLNTLKSIRSQSAREIQNHGYYYFIPDFIGLKADTTGFRDQLDLIVSRNPLIPPEALKSYTIDRILIQISGSGLRNSIRSDTLRMEHVDIVSDGDYLKPEVLLRGIYFQQGKIYTRMAYEQTLSYLNSLGVFSYARISLEQPDTTLQKLNVRIDLLMAKNIHLDLEADMVTKSTGFAGPAVMVAVNHGNAFGGAEKIHVGLSGNFEWQWGRKAETQLGTFSYEAGITSGLTLPKVLIPERWKSYKPLYIRQTSVNLDLKLLNRTAYYQMFSIMSNLNYRWGKTQKMQHSFSPVYLNQISLLRTTPAFDSVVNENIYIRKSFEEQYIIGMRYAFIYDDTYLSRPNNLYLMAAVNTSGNLTDLLYRVGSVPPERPYAIANNVYSQYLKFTGDFRYYRNWRQQSMVMRLYAGIGLPYLNSTVLPYVEQFFSGGAYSIRGFTARYLGPGSYYEDKSGYIDQSGDMKLEANLEYRFGISKVLKGAVFLETGNIWLINEDENRPGSGFDRSTFIDELAVG